MFPVLHTGIGNVLGVHLKKVSPVLRHVFKHLVDDLGRFLGTEPCNLSASRNQVFSAGQS